MEPEHEFFASVKGSFENAPQKMAEELQYHTCNGSCDRDGCYGSP